MAYSSVKNTALKSLDSIHHTALLLASGAFHTTSITSLLTLASFARCADFEKFLHAVRKFVRILIFVRNCADFQYKVTVFGNFHPNFYFNAQYLN